MVQSRRLATLCVMTSIACSSQNQSGDSPALQASGPANADAPQAHGRQFKPPFYVFSPNAPRDIVFDNSGAIGFQPFVQNLAWETFIALNWPVPENPIPENTVERGIPDRMNVVGGMRPAGGDGSRKPDLPTGPTVWETFKDTHEIFLNPPVAPAPFDAPETVPASNSALALEHPRAARRTLSETSKVSDILRDFKQAADDFELIDQNGEKVWYEVKVNRAYFDYVVENGFYDSRNQKGKTIAFPQSSNTTREEPAIKIKAAWKIMGGPESKQPDDATKFYTTEALIIDAESGAGRVELVGLVGLHVVQKTETLPQWMWATFEHVDNAPDETGPVPGQQYNFFDPNCDDCPPNAPSPPDDPTQPTQVMRLTAIDKFSPNAIYQQALRTLREDNVWQNYELVDAQWAGTREHIGQPVQPKFLANSTMETSVQAAVEPNGCINCHGKFAAATDLDFQLGKAYPR